MINPVAYIVKEIQDFILSAHPSNAVDVQKGQNLIRFHNHKTESDVSFPANASVWMSHFDDDSRLGTNKMLHKSKNLIPEDQEGLKYFVEKFLSEAGNWRFPVEGIERMRSCERFALFFQRTKVTSEILRMVLGGKSYGCVPKNPLRRIYNLAKRNDKANLTYYRAALIRRTLDRVLVYSDWTVVDPNQGNEDGVLEIEVLSVAAANCEQDVRASIGRKVIVYCGIVLDPKSGKLVSTDAAEYINLRTNDLNLMALHKYGIRAKNDQSYEELMNCLGVAAVTVDLLEKKCSCPATIIRNGQGSNTKGACFILYNSARLETLLKTFEIRVNSGQYGPLPLIEEVDFSLLNSEEEWQLIFGYVLTFPDLIERCLRQLDNGQFASHLIVQYLSGLVGTFSGYYRRIRILTEYRSQLMAQLYARVYLLKAVQDVLNKALGLLDIDPVSHM